MPEKNKFFAGVQTYIISKRYLEDEFGKLRSAQHFFLLSYGVFDWLAIDLKGGAGNIKQHPFGRDEIDYTSNFAGGYGLRLRFFNREDINPVRNTESPKKVGNISNGVKMVLGFQHISIHPKTTHLGEVQHKAILDDWQWSLLASRDLKRITPYLGARWSRIDYIHRVNGDRKRRMSDLTKDIGLLAGLDLTLSGSSWLNLEGEFLDSQAFSLSLNYSF